MNSQINNWILVCNSDEIDLEDLKRFDHEGSTFCIYRLEDGFFATDGLCTHESVHLEEGLIYFFTKNSIIMGACGLGIEGKIGRDIRLAEKIAEKKVKVTKEILSDKNLKLNKVLSSS